MTEGRAALVGVVTFIVALALCVALFEALDVSAGYLIGPAIAVAAGAYAAYRTALQRSSRTRDR